MTAFEAAEKSGGAKDPQKEARSFNSQAEQKSEQGLPLHFRDLFACYCCPQLGARSLLIMLFLVVSTPRPERPSELVGSRQSFWPWIAGYQARWVCRHIFARAGRGAVAVLDVGDNDALHRILNEWADCPHTSRRSGVLCHLETST